MSTLSKLTVLRDHIDALIQEEKKAESTLPESWNGLKEINGCYILYPSTISGVVRYDNNHESHRNIWPTRELAEAALAMSQIAQLRAEYWRQAGDWKPDWTDGSAKDCIVFYHGRIETPTSTSTHNFLAFKPGTGQRDHFLEHHRELIEQAKPLL